LLLALDSEHGHGEPLRGEFPTLAYLSRQRLIFAVAGASGAATAVPAPPPNDVRPERLAPDARA
jgi:hypothetical protein